MLEAILKSTLRRCARLQTQGKIGPSGIVDELTNSIFARKEGRYLFLFNQNFRRTNIQIAELVALILKHSTTNSLKLLPEIAPAHIDFTTFAVVKRHVSALVANGNINNATDVSNIIKELQRYTSNKIIIEVHYGSCSVFFPPHITTDILKICGESGYIHSCGPLLLLRNATKVDRKRFRQAINDAIALSPPDSKFMLIPYCHEDFSRSDRNRTPFLKYGLDDVKVHLSKAYVGEETLSAALDREAQHFKSVLLLAPAGEYSHVPAIFDGEFENSERNTIWIISDSDWSPRSYFPGEKKFYIVYLQSYYSVNLLHNFEENKPGWASHTTLPHSLTGAMINIGRPWASNPESISLWDPFGGSGTTLLEASKLDTVQPYASDMAPIYKWVNQTNIEFFQQTAPQLRKLLGTLRRFAEIPALSTMRPSKRPPRGDRRWIEAAIARAQKWARATKDDFLRLDERLLDDAFAEFGKSLEKQILLYTALKAIGRGRGEIERGSTHVMDAFRAEMKEVIEAAERMLRAIELPEVPSSELPPDSPLTLVYGDYSKAVRTSVSGSGPLLTDLTPHFKKHKVGSRNVLDAAYKGQANHDIIVTDPPYGFNTKEDFWETADEVRSWLSELIESLKPEGGQLILACPDVSFSGRSVLPFVQANFLAREIVKIAAELKRECLTPALNLPPTGGAIRPPYYWVAEKTLRRKILHFWIRELPSNTRSEGHDKTREHG